MRTSLKEIRSPNRRAFGQLPRRGRELGSMPPPRPLEIWCVPDIAFSDIVSMRLGMPVFGEGKGCNYYGQILDPLGYHVLACMRQGNKYGIHNSLRDTVHRYAELAGLRPILEPTGLLANDPHLRPADILIVAPPSLTPNSWRKFPRLALDLAVTSPMLYSHLSEAAHPTLSSASRYAERKRH